MIFARNSAVTIWKQMFKEVHNLSPETDMGLDVSNISEKLQV